MDMKQKKTGKGNSFPTNCREVQQTKDMEINEKIRYFRKQRGISQELLAERTGINVNTIRKYEIGIRKPKVEQLKKIADREFVAGWSILLEIGISRLFIFKRGLLDNLSGSGKEPNSDENISPPSVSATVIC